MQTGAPAVKLDLGEPLILHVHVVSDVILLGWSISGVDMMLRRELLAVWVDSRLYRRVYEP